MADVDEAEAEGDDEDMFSTDYQYGTFMVVWKGANE